MKCNLSQRKTLPLKVEERIGKVKDEKEDKDVSVHYTQYLGQIT
jgi:hypothetical protein